MRLVKLERILVATDLTEPHRAISSLAGKVKADVVVLGRGDGTRRPASERPVGSMAYAFVTHTLVPVLVVAEPLSAPMHNALAVLLVPPAVWRDHMRDIDAL